MFARQFAFLLGLIASLAVGLSDLAAGLHEDQILFAVWIFLLIFAGIGFALGIVAEEICRYVLITTGTRNAVGPRPNQATQ
jgi:hypothetical protein